MYDFKVLLKKIHIVSQCFREVYKSQQDPVGRLCRIIKSCTKFLQDIIVLQGSSQNPTRSCRTAVQDFKVLHKNPTGFHSPSEKSTTSYRILQDFEDSVTVLQDFFTREKRRDSFKFFKINININQFGLKIILKDLSQCHFQSFQSSSKISTSSTGGGAVWTVEAPAAG